MTTAQLTETYANVLSSFGETTPIEIRFHAEFREQKNYQLLATAGNNGQVYYTLHYNPRGTCSMSLTYITSSNDNNPVTLPMKAYSGWQKDVLAWIGNMEHYTVDEVL